MELTELQNIWGQYEKKLTDNTRINKEILRRMLISKPEKRLNRIKINAGFNLILPIVLILLVLVPHLQFRSSIDFYVGLGLFTAVLLITYIWAIRYYLLICKIDFSEPILAIKKRIAELEKYKIKITRIGFIFTPFAMTGVFIMAQIPFFSINSIVPFSLIILVMITSIYYTFKYSIYERFRKLNIEIKEIEELEKE
jgi:hypothetical protein